MANSTRIRNIRQPIPKGTIIGRRQAGTGPVELLSVADLARQAAAAGVVPPSNGITALNGDVAAGPGSGSQVATIQPLAVSTGKIAANAVTTAKLSTTGVSAGSYTYASITVAVDGRITAASSGASPLTSVGGSSKAIQYNNGGTLGGIGPLTNGQLVIGSTGATSVAGSLTQPAAGLTITGGAGSITFALANDLAALEAMSGTGLVARTASETYAQRTITGAASKITVSNGDGVSGNPTITLADTAVTPGSYTLASITVDQQGRITAASSGSGGSGTPAGSDKAIQYNNGGSFGGLGPLTNGQLVIGSTGATSVAASLTAPAAGITITGGAGSITFALGNDLAALEAMSGTGLVARTASETYAQRTITGTSSRLTVSNGDGVSGDPTLDISSSYVGQATITTLGTIGTGTWAGTTISVDHGGTGQTSYTDGQLLIGNMTGNTLAKGTLTAGTGITVTNGHGSITLAVADTAVTPASYTYASITVDQQGRLTAASSGTAPATAANPTATASDTAVNGSASTFMRSDGAPAIQKASSSVFGLVKVDGTSITASGGVVSASGASGANPTATAGDTAVNGVATTYMRSDGAPAIQKASSSVFGLAKVDNSTITAASGVITAVLPTAANPTATAGDTAVNGSAATFMRSDGAPAIQKATSGQFGLVKVDGTSITAASGVISAAVIHPNILINPFCEIDQANEGATVSADGSYIVDGWVLGKSGSATVTAGRVADAPPGMTNSVKLTVGTGAAVGSTDFLSIRQPIEADCITDCAFGGASAQSLSLSFWVKCSIGSYVMSGSIRNAAGTRSYPFNFTITSSATWEQKTITIPGDTTGTWVLSTTAAGVNLNLTAAVGSGLQGTVNTWVAANRLGTSANTNTVLSTNGATFQITGVKLEIGTSNTTLVRENFAETLLRCQRYFRKSYPEGNAPGAVVGGSVGWAMSGLPSATYTVSMVDRWGPSMRAQPTVTVYSPNSGASNKAFDNVSGADTAAPSANVRNTTGISYTVAATAASTQVSITVHYTADARL